MLQQVNPPGIIQPGIYPGPGKAQLLRAGMYGFLLQNNLATVGQKSVAVQLERIRTQFYYPVGFSLEISFSGAPGTFEIDCEVSDTDQEQFFVQNTKITTGLNSSNVGRIEVTTYWALFTRVNIVACQNAVNITVKLTR